MHILKRFGFSTLALLMVTNCQISTKAHGKNRLKQENLNKQSQINQKTSETPEQKAIRLAEEFIKRNGYTDVPADKNNLSRETVEFYKNTDELLKQRYNSLESKAYGVSHHGRKRFFLEAVEKKLQSNPD